MSFSELHIFVVLQIFLSILQRSMIATGIGIAIAAAASRVWCIRLVW